jgi:hypothetical protein
MIILLLTSLLSCSGNVGNNNAAGNDSNNNAAIPEQEQQNPEDTPEPASELPVKDFGGEKITFMVSTETLWGYDQMDAEEQTGDVINDAIYLRNRAIEEKYNVYIAQTDMPFGDFESTVKKNETAGSAEYDVLLPRLYYGINLAQGGFLYDINKIPHIDMSQPCWDSSIKRDLTLVNKLFFAAGDINMYANDATWILFFNKDLHKNLGLADIYSLVLDGKWTLDVFAQMLTDVTSDLNGDGTITYEDRLGFISMNHSISSMLGAANEPVFVKDGEESIKLNITGEKFNAVYDKIMSVFNDGDRTLAVDNTAKWKLPAARMVGDTVQEIFMNNRALFVAEVMDCITRYKAMDTDFGVLPFPKYEETQDVYISSVISDALVLSIPISCRNTEMVGLIVEAMAEKSHTTLLPAYYETTLQRKRARDEESLAMLDIIFGNRIYQLGMIYNWGGITSSVCNELNKNSNGLASLYEKNEQKVNAAIEKTLEAYKAIE